MKTVDLLNSILKKDPNAIHCLLSNRIPCSKEIAEDPHVIVELSLVFPNENYILSPLGLINGVLSANNLPLIAMVFSDTPNDKGGRDLIGFCELVEEKREDGVVNLV